MKIIYPKYEILIVDDTPDWQTRLKKLVGSEKRVMVVNSVKDANIAINKFYFLCALVDQSLDTDSEGEDALGLDVVKKIADMKEGTKCYMITAYQDPDIAFEAGKGLQIEGYISKAALSTSIDIIHNKINLSVNDAFAWYERNYHTAIPHITSGNRDEAHSWEGNVISAISSGKASGGYNSLVKLLNRLMKGFFPVIPYLPNKLPTIDNKYGVVSAKYWSKSLGCGVDVRFGRSISIETELTQLQDQETKILSVHQESSYKGYISRLPESYEEIFLIK